ncbi:YciI family protein [Pseudoruegeria sp. SK021]|uniref:YciI family protein n=1 Tax=Pseudoruegeria sp. SK021 TaxID=1933035 RepID=UPI000A24078E|nr:YciI family protein [Pseudoruegeria sp. SK021]OSP54610.1 hypothetical protein BV911_11425 [Pseudoruegeria sp. SK021]
MFYAVIGHDKPGALEVRKANRPDHVAYLKSSGVVMQAGPLLDAEGEMNGSLVILDVASAAEAEAWVAADPYGKVGLFDSISVLPWNRVIG